MITTFWPFLPKISISFLSAELQVSIHRRPRPWHSTWPSPPQGRYSPWRPKEAQEQGAQVPGDRQWWVMVIILWYYHLWLSFYGIIIYGIIIIIAVVITIHILCNEQSCGYCTTTVSVQQVLWVLLHYYLLLFIKYNCCRYICNRCSVLLFIVVILNYCIVSYRTLPRSSELFHTEKLHLRSLKIMKMLYERPMRAEPTISNITNLLFPNLDELIRVHGLLLCICAWGLNGLIIGWSTVCE